MARSPTDQEFARYDGMHCAVIWRTLPHDWKCPVCNRSKREILIWGKRKGSNAAIYGEIGFKAGIHGHHDHGDILAFGRLGRFATTYICGACNNLDARLKKRLATVPDFSFSPDELSSCLMSVEPNEGIKSENIDFEKAMTIYKKVMAEHEQFMASIPSYPNTDKVVYADGGFALKYGKTNTHQLFQTVSHEHLEYLVTCAIGDLPDSCIVIVECGDGRWFVETDFGNGYDHIIGVSKPDLKPYIEPTFFQSERYARVFAYKCIKEVHPELVNIDLDGFIDRD